MDTHEMSPETPVENVSKKESILKGIGKEALLIAGSILLGSLIIAGTLLALSSASFLSAKGTGEDTAAGTETNLADPTDTTATVSLDDDPTLGDKKKAKVAIVEFSDFECPFCKRFHADTYDTLIKDYVDTGKATYTFRDFPLSFHDPKATEEAAVAECVQKEKGDSAYFAFGKEVFKETISNGKGLPDGKLDELIRKVGANPQSVNTCAKSDEIKKEIAKDLADGQAAGISGTPSFVIGKIDENGNVTGERIVGALPLSGFKTALDKYLAE